jgi:hypothetical protein
MVHVALQLLDVLPKSVGWILKCAVEHCCAGETTSPMPTTRGDSECSGVNVAAHFGRSLDLQFDSQEQIPLQSKKAVNIVLVFDG